MTDTKELLEIVLSGDNLSEDQAASVMHLMTLSEVPAATKGAFLAALRVKGETADELRGFARAMRDAALVPDIPRDGILVDTCGTGGDGSDSINVSTAASLVAAAGGCGVVKHGNRSISSKSGSADVLEALGVKLCPDPDAAAAMFRATGWTFLFAPNFHPAMKEVMPVRRALGVRTVFNMLGPLTNPARPDYQLLGAYSEHAAELMAHALAGLGVKNAFVVHGAPGWDEATPIGPFIRFDVKNDEVHRRILDPADSYGIPECTVAELAGGDAQHNAAALRAVFEGRQGPHRDAIVLNAALVFELTGIAGDGRSAVRHAQQIIDSGKVVELLDKLAAHG